MREVSTAITLGGLLQTLGIVCGFLACLFGMLMVFAGGMSDAPGDGDATSKSGCIVFLCGVALIVGCTVWIVM